MLSINAERFLADMEELAQIGATASGGVSRPALGAQDLQARAWLQSKFEALGLDYEQDGAANQFGTLRADVADAKTLLIGSHLDSVPDGGRYDGALGVLCALEVVRRLQESEHKLPFHLACVNFTDEEGTLMGLMGSRAVSGQMSADDLQNPRGGRSRLEAAMQRAGISDASILGARRSPDDLLGYIEVHIEQGTRLEQAELQVGVVTALVGIRMKRLTFTGQAAHAGTTPVNARRDAFLGVADFALRAHDLVLQKHMPGVVNVGEVAVEPGAFNIVPGQVTAALEFRHGSQEELDALEHDLLSLAQTVADERRLELKIDGLGEVRPATMDTTLTRYIEAASEVLGLGHTRLMSFAGHDPQNMANIVPSALLFVPSVDGISHNPREYTPPQDCINGANVLLHTVLRLAENSE